MIDLIKAGTGIVTELGKGIIEHFFPNKIEQQQKMLEFQTLLAKGEFRADEARMNAIIAEAQSKDKWTSRARPSFLYVFCIYILAALPLGALYVYDPGIAKQFIEGVKLWFEAMPKILYELFGAGFLGYTIARSYEKKQLMKLLNNTIK
jgi:hypothetical protein